MSITKKLLLSIVIGMTGLATVHADVKIGRADLLPSQKSATAKHSSASDIYIVQMKGIPVIAYEGDIKGYKATKPGKGKKLNANSAHVKKYAAHLGKKQSQVMRSVGARQVHSYRYAINGFAARMTAAAAERLKKNPEVMNVWKDEIRQLQTDSSPTYIGLTEGGQAWSKGLTGEDVVIGVIDTGIWPEHPSFADVKTPKKGNKGPNIAYDSLSDFSASGCDFGNTAANPYDAPFSCNNKLVAARCYNSGFSSGPDAGNPCGGDGALTQPWEFQSARDADGHGSHTAGTAGGNYGVPAYLNGELQGMVSGVAPRARVAAYKVCWSSPGGDGCASSDSAAAIDQAVVDGVDVINFSIGGASNSFGGADDVAFLFAAAAGVHVATSNGNSGPGAGTVGTPSGVPWITAVGATNDDDVFYADVEVHTPGSIAGTYDAVEGAGDVSMRDTGAISDDVTLASTVTACDVDGPNDPISGIALVARGACSFTQKYNNVMAAGASAIIVYTYPGEAPITMSAPGTGIPGVMVTYDTGVAMANESGVTATMSLVPALNRIAGFSSRGPNNGALDIIKPDVSAPGVRILAAVSPWSAGGEMFGNYNGTSMASPHTAGAFALLKQAHPDWSPAMSRSALMTTGRNGLKKTFGEELADPFDVGAGEILPSDAVDPGLAYDAGLFDYAAFSCENNVQIFDDASCEFLESIGVPSDGSDLNLPSIGIGDLAGSQTITRTVTAVYNNNGSKNFTVSVDAPPGVDVSVSPSSFSLRKGDSISYEVTFTLTESAAINEWAFGSLTWTDDDENYHVRSPIAVYPTVFSYPDQVDGVADGAGDGSVDVEIGFGYDGVYSAAVAGIEAGFSASGNSSALDPVAAWCADLPAMSHFRSAMFDEDTSDPGNDDLDIEVFYLPNGCGNFAGYSFMGGSYTPTSEESVDVANAPAGGYHVQVYYFAASNGTDSDYTLWYQPVLGDNGNTTVTAPVSAEFGAATVTVDYTGVAPTRNLGVLIHSDDGGEMGRTVLSIDGR